MKNTPTIYFIVLLSCLVFSGCASTTNTSQSSYKSQVVKEDSFNIYDKEGYYQGYIKSKPNGKYQMFDKEGYYIGETRKN